MWVPDKYKFDLAATAAAVRRWQRRNPLAKPVLPDCDPPLLMAVTIALDRHVTLEGDALALAKYVADQVHDASWMMLWGAWNHYYGEQGPQGGEGATHRSPGDKPN